MKFVKPLLLDSFDNWNNGHIVPDVVLQSKSDEELLKEFYDDPEVKRGGGSEDLLYELLTRKLITANQLSELGYSLVTAGISTLFYYNNFDALTYLLDDGAEDIIFHVIDTKWKELIFNAEIKFLIDYEPTYYDKLCKIMPKYMHNSEFDVYKRGNKTGLWGLEQEKFSTFEAKTVDVTPMSDDILDMIEKQTNQFAEDTYTKLVDGYQVFGIGEDDFILTNKDIQNKTLTYCILKILYLQKSLYIEEDSDYYLYKEFSNIFDKYDNEETIIWLIELGINDILDDLQKELIKILEEEPAYINANLLKLIKTDFLPDYLKRGKSSGLLGMKNESVSHLDEIRQNVKRNDSESSGLLDMEMESFSWSLDLSGRGETEIRQLIPQNISRADKSGLLSIKLENLSTDPLPNSRLYRICQSDNYKELKNYIDYEGKDTYTSEGLTPLMNVALVGKVKLAKYLVKREVDLNLLSTKAAKIGQREKIPAGASALMIAIQMNNNGVAKVLLDAGADIYLPKYDCMTWACGGTGIGNQSFPNKEIIEYILYHRANDLDIASFESYLDILDGDLKDLDKPWNTRTTKPEILNNKKKIIKGIIELLTDWLIKKDIAYMKYAKPYLNDKQKEKYSEDLRGWKADLWSMSKF